MVLKDRKQDHAMAGLTARLLVLGDRGVGKSASIVRYTTGRFIQEYGDTNDQWLYRKRLADVDDRVSLVELIEQRDVQLPTKGELARQHSPLGKLQNFQATSGEPKVSDNLKWASAYIIIYAINDINSYTKAIRYLNFIENQSSVRTVPRRQKTSRVSTNSANSTDIGYIKGNQFNRKSIGLNKSNNPPEKDPSQPSWQSREPGQRPILLLGNKKDLAATGRQVSTSEARSLASRHQAAFAEISIAESHTLLSKVVSDFVKTIELANLSEDYRFTELPSQPIVSFTQLNEALASSKTGTKLAIEAASAKLANSELVVSTLIQSTCVVGSARSNTQRGRALPMTCRSIRRPNKSLMSPVYEVASIGHQNGSKSPSNQHLSRPSAHSYHDKYENLKSSLKKASMAIVSSKKTNKSTKNNPHPDRSDSRSSSSTQTSIDYGDLASQDGQSSGEVHKVSTVFEASSNWIRSHIKPNRSQSGSISDPKLNCSQIPVANASTRIPIGDRFTRPLLKYTNRRKTVAFEPIKDCEISDNDRDMSDPIIKSRSIPSSFIARGTGEVGSYDSTRCSSCRSSLSTSEALSGSKTADWTDHESSAGSTSATPSSTATTNDIRTGNDSRSELSRASTSATDSYDITDEDEDTPPTLRASSICGLPPLAAGSGVARRCQLVKSVQTTLSSLSKSSAPRRSFCNSLFKNTKAQMDCKS